MSKLYGESQRQLQRQFDTERLADRIEQRLFREHITDDDRAFIERLDMFFLATADRAGRPNCSYKGGDPGFVRVIDPQTLVFPNYDGNGMYLSMGNAVENPNVGLLFIDFENQEAVARKWCRADCRRKYGGTTIRGSPVRREIGRAPGVSQLPTVHPQAAEDRAIAVCASPGGTHTGAGLEAHGLGLRRVASRRRCSSA